MNQYIYTSSAGRPAISDSCDSLFPLTSERPGDRAQSLSGSDDGSFGVHKNEIEVEGVCTHSLHTAACTYYQSEDVALTSQTLNTDGTPKRPMNAFMIFARRRRPQVSAENQSMRTGEISKLLSKEWTTMPMVSKTRALMVIVWVRMPIVRKAVLSWPSQNFKRKFQFQISRLCI